MKKLKSIDYSRDILCSVCDKVCTPNVFVSVVVFARDGDNRIEIPYCGSCWSEKNHGVMPIDKFCTDCGMVLMADFLNYNNNKNKLYCNGCWSKKFEEPVNEDKLNKLLDASINTPPLRLKDLKARLKKEREEKRKRAE